jgi:hypothetical protein
MKWGESSSKDCMDILCVVSLSYSRIAPDSHIAVVLIYLSGR